jgi:hypothetical protein
VKEEQHKDEDQDEWDFSPDARGVPRWISDDLLFVFDVSSRPKCKCTVKIKDIQA